MTNEQKYKTAQSRSREFDKFCEKRLCYDCPLNKIDKSLKCYFVWLAIETKEEVENNTHE